MKQFLTSQPRRNTAAFALVLVALLLVFSLAHAAHTTINTNDGIVDPNWINVGTLHSDIVGDTISPNYDLTDVYVANDAAMPTEFYFRADIVGVEEPGTNIEVLINCNGGIVFDPEDIHLIANADSAGTGGSVSVYSGDGLTGPDIYGGEYVEAIGDGPTTFEWRAPVTDGTGGTVNWSACFGTIGLRYEILMLPDLDRAPDGGTAGYDVPTIVELQSFNAGANNEPSPILWLVGAGALLALGGLLVILRRLSVT